MFACLHAVRPLSACLPVCLSTRLLVHSSTRLLINQAAVRVQSLVGGACDVHYYRLNLLQQELVSEHKRGLVDEP